MAQKYNTGTKHYVPFADKFLRIIAYGEGYYLVRYVGCYPFVKSEKELTELLTKQP